MANFTLHSASTNLKYLDWSKTASTAFAEGKLITANNNNTHVGFALADATSVYHIGVIAAAVAATDSDYASTTRQNLLVDMFGEYDAVVAAAHAADANDEGYPADLNASQEINLTASTVDVFLVRKFLSATLVRGFIRKWGYLGW